MLLNNGVKIPDIGYGTFMLSSEDTYKNVLLALESGVRLIDTANSYRNEVSVGKAIADSKIKRKDIFVSTKLWPYEYINPNAIDETLDRLGLEYIDLLFLHQPSGYYKDAYKMIERAYKEGKVKAIGLSNFEGKYFDEIMSICEIKPQVMQMEVHPYNTEEEFREKLDKDLIRVMSWYPLGHGDAELMDETVIQSLSGKYEKTPAHVILRWHYENSLICIPGSNNPEHIKENAIIDDIDLLEEEIDNISQLNRYKRYFPRNEEVLENYSNISIEYEK